MSVQLPSSPQVDANISFSALILTPIEFLADIARVYAYGFT